MMRTLSNVLISVLITAWFVTIAVISIQNITPVSLNFLTFSSVEIPFGVLLTFGVGVGLLIGAMLPLVTRR
ncbi:lipopolysaccharide assembly protein LapA domain-containing protein [Spirulina subsalsa]|uniref:lipopolysaccharide assembly protein LapA domain-containing protein n=1 Tax=Spirulina subsalsa TaxID=54311 RepID=UPI0002D7FD61|nr:lipopolysaccharide assembly protein LapA domain-containing protein [Spirulina subsalsa]